LLPPLDLFYTASPLEDPNFQDYRLDVGALIVSFVRTAGIQFFSEVELAVLYLIAAVVLPVKPTGLFGDA